MITAFVNRRPWPATLIALFLSPLIGMLYLGRWLWALVYALVAAWMILLPLLSAHFGFLPTQVGVTTGGLAATFCLVGALHCYREAGEDGGRTSEDRLLAVFLLLGGPLVLALVPKVLWEPYSIPAASMEPSLQVGDYLFVSKFVYRFVEPQRGDVAVFLLPSDNTTTYIKRLIGLPGDRIQMKEGSLYLNDVRVPRDEVEQGRPDLGPGEVYREKLTFERSYLIREMSDSMPYDNTAVFEVPPDHYFFMGDNRDNSLDSRNFIGFVPRKNLKGRLAAVVWNAQTQKFRLEVPD